ncbi:MAG: preprotein translocase subunit SecA [Cytophagales bacterium]|nr:preprotein translocase subunit SecA [Bernardetiaceae bacterium]MDW8210185.1 preprotein translocase subunit SecA [Cytophagales bacterium]
MLNFITKGIAKLFGTKSERDLKQLNPLVAAINEEYTKLKTLSDDELREKTFQFKEFIAKELSDLNAQLEQLHQRLAHEVAMDIDQKEKMFQQIDRLEKEHDKKLEEVLSKLLPQAFAVVRETAYRFAHHKQLVVKATPFDHEIAASRQGVTIEGDKAIWHNQWMAAGNMITWDMVHYDVQLIGGIVLHQGKIAEMATGEGKTLVATLPAYLNALGGKGVHIVTVNDYLARRDCEWMGPIYEFHCLRVDCIDKYPPNTPQRRRAYLADITYGTNNEFGFDYLRDNMAREISELVQRKLHFAMVDEVDSVLIDDARTPLIISGPVGTSNEDERLYYELKPRVSRLVEAQKQLIIKLLNEAKKLLAEGKDEEGGLALFRAYRGLPKNKPLIKFLSEPGIKTKMQKVENFYLQDNAKMMPEADKPLYFVIDEKNNSVELTQNGINFITEVGEDPNFFVLPDIGAEIANIDKNPTLSQEEKLRAKDQLLQEYTIKNQRIHCVNQLLKAYTLFERDVDYIIADGKVKIVDEQTGRILEGRRYSDGLHQALEAKENVKVEESTQTYATITLQNYFRMYHKLAGMTGTASTEANEFWEIYKLDVVEIPTHKPVIRKDYEDKVYKTLREKYNAIVAEIQELVNAGRPVLVGTTSVENSELLSRMLQMRKIPHQVLNAKHHAREAEIVAHAGIAGTVTIATNMAGRGTDIKLTPESRQAGGLAIIGTERHESRRVDRQLRGRAGRQGDPGSSQFFVSLEDDLMRLFGSERIAKIMDRLGLQEGEVIQHPMITRSIERAQKKVEENNFGIRKRLLEYDDVMNAQREVIYRRRRNALFGERLSLDIMTMFYDVCQEIAENHKGDYENFKLNVISQFGFSSSITFEQFAKGVEVATEALYEEVYSRYRAKNKHIAEITLPLLQHVFQTQGAVFRDVALTFTDGKKFINIITNLQQAVETGGRSLIQSMEQSITLAIIDQLWKEHLREMDDLRQSVQFATLEQKDPLLIYKFEAFELFKALIGELNSQITSFLFRAIPYDEGQAAIQSAQAATSRQRQPKLSTNKQGETLSTQSDNKKAQPNNRQNVEVTKPIIAQKLPGRNEKVTVRYLDGRVVQTKFKNVEQDLKENKCILL